MTSGGQWHHCIPRKVIKERYRTFAYHKRVEGYGREPFSLPEALTDKRNLKWLSTDHHERVTNVRIYVKREELPDGIEDFAEALGLGWYLARYYPHSDSKVTERLSDGRG